VNDLHQDHKGLSAETTRLEAWNSIAAHSQGLEKFRKTDIMIVIRAITYGNVAGNFIYCDIIRMDAFTKVQNDTADYEVIYPSPVEVK
jgi:hypothetical protein